MKTLTVEADVSVDGMLHLAVPSGLPPGRVEVVLVVQPVAGTNGTAKTGYEWLLDPKYDNIGRGDADLPDNLTEEERFKRMSELLEIALKGVTWAEIEEGRRDDPWR